MIATRRGGLVAAAAAAAAVTVVMVVLLAAALGCKKGGAPKGTGVAAGDAGHILAFEGVKDGNQDIWVLPAKGGVPRRLTQHPGQDGLPRWNADGSSVIFASDRTGHWQLFVVSESGGAERPLRTNEFIEYQADFSPDGSRLAFLSRRGEGEWLWLTDVDGGNERPLIRHGAHSVLGNPEWAPDGRRITFSSNWQLGHQIYVVDSVTGEERRISPALSGGCEPRFRPDGQAVVYVSRRHLKSTSHLVEHDLVSGEERVLVDWPALNYDPVYSLDGTELAFASNITGSYQIYRQRLPDGQAYRVTFGLDWARYPDYRPRS